MKLRAGAANAGVVPDGGFNFSGVVP